MHIKQCTIPDEKERPGLNSQHLQYSNKILHHKHQTYVVDKYGLYEFDHFKSYKEWYRHQIVIKNNERQKLKKESSRSRA